MIEFYKRTVGKLPMIGQLAFWALLVYLTYRGYRWFKKWRESQDYNASVTQAQTAIQQLGQQGITPSYAQAQYTSWGNNLKGAFEGCSGAGDANSFWAVITSVFGGLKNDADVYALIKAYGVRTFDKCGILTGDFTGDLAGSLSEKFSGLEGFAIRYSMSDINEILQKNGITFRF